MTIEHAAGSPASLAQQRLWFLEQLEALGSAYHLPRFIRLRGALDEAALARALAAVVARHAALRTAFHDPARQEFGAASVPVRFDEELTVDG